jgi:hypothetical protein
MRARVFGKELYRNTMPCILFLYSSSVPKRRTTGRNRRSVDPQNPGGIRRGKEEWIMPKKAIVFLAEGFEEVEALTPVDYLRRAGVEVTTVSIGQGAEVRGSHGIVVNADRVLAALEGEDGAGAWDAVILPGGGKGADNLASSAAVGGFVTAMDRAG